MNTATESKQLVRASTQVRQIERRYRGGGESFVALHRVARWVAQQWAGETEQLLAP